MGYSQVRYMAGLRQIISLLLLLLLVASLKRQENESSNWASDSSHTPAFIFYVATILQVRTPAQDPSRSIQIDAFHVFKLFVANKNKPPEIVSILVTNRSKLLCLLGAFVYSDSLVDMHKYLKFFGTFFVD